MKGFRLFLLVLPLLVSGSLFAQSYDGGAIVNVGYEQGIVKNFNFNLDAEGRFDQWCTSFDRFKLAGSFDYSFLKKKRLKVSVAACYLLYGDQALPEHRGRVIGAITYTEKIHQFKISYRVRIQSTFYDERYGEYNHNPKTYLRNRLQLGYSWKDKGVSLYASTEFFLRLYEPEKCFVDNFRSIVGCDFKLNDRHTLGVYFRVDNEIQVKNRENLFYLGVKYSFENPRKQH